MMKSAMGTMMIVIPKPPLMHEARPFLTPSQAGFIAQKLSQPTRVGGRRSPYTSFGWVISMFVSIMNDIYIYGDRKPVLIRVILMMTGIMVTVEVILGKIEWP